MVSDPLRFNLQLLKGRIAQFKEAERVSDSVVFFDRGIPDVLAYMTHYNQELGPEFVAAAETYRYDFVFLLPMWEQIFVYDEERFERYDEALEIQDRLWQVYGDYGYTPIEVPRGSIEERTTFILKAINQ